MDIIILAAGQSKRFQEEGYYTPKPFLEIEWRGTTLTMMEHVFNTLLPPAHGSDNVFVGIPAGWRKQVPKAKSIHNNILHNAKFVEIENSKGPAHTALKLIQIANARYGYLIIDTDVLNFTNDLIDFCESWCSSVLVSRSANPAFSYVDKLNLFTRIEEKKRISEYAVRGAYFIYSGQKFKFIEKLEEIVAEKEEPYISHALNLIDEKRSFLTTYTPIDWGTPRDIILSGARIVTPKEGGKICM